MYSDAFGCVRMQSDAFGCVLMLWFFDTVGLTFLEISDYGAYFFGLTIQRLPE